MKEFVLDAKTWRCGGLVGNGEITLGKGITYLLNEKGYMCCLGQASLQFNKKLKEKDIIEKVSPENVYKPISKLNEKIGKFYLNTELSKEAMKINDSNQTTPAEKVKLLKALFKKHGVKMRVKNTSVYKNI